MVTSYTRYRPRTALPSYGAPLTSPTFPAIYLPLLAERTGASCNMLWRVFRGNRRPSLELARRIAEALDVTLDELYDELAPKWDVWEEEEMGWRAIE